MAQNQNEHHIISSKILVNVCFALLGLTLLTVVTARMHLGIMAAPIAFLIAAVKAYLVMAYFMGLKYDDKSNRLIFAAGFAFLALLFFFAAIDVFTRIPATSTL